MAPVFALSLCAFISASTAWQFKPAVSPSFSRDTQGTILRKAAQHPNATTSVPLLVNNVNATLRVNVTDLALPGLESDITNPRTVITTWDIAWPANYHFNTSIQDLSCVSNIGGTIDPQAAVSDGSCTPAFGSKCVGALQSSLPACQNSPNLASNVCDKAFTNAPGLYSATFSNRTFIHDPAVVWVSYLNQPTADTSKDFKVATQQVQYILFRDGSESPKGYPVCVRVSAGLLLGVGLRQWVLIGIAALFVYAVM